MVNSPEKGEKYKQMKAIRDEIVALKESPLYKHRKENNFYPVIGEGSHDATIMFIGEAPGLNEAKTGKPFCGRSGKVLDELLASISVARDSVYVTNIVKDRPPENRDPTPEEIALYGPFLDRQIDIIRPKVIATLGRYSMVYIMEKFGLKDILRPISSMHGQAFLGETKWGEVTIVPLYHPAVAVYNASTKETLFEDFKILKKYQ
jgi:uracil-DNA glycosylase family 4